MNRHYRISLGTLFCTVFSLVTGAAATTAVTYQDATFANADWTTAWEVLGGGGSANGFQVVSGGNPGSYRRLDLTLNSAVGTGTNSAVYALGFFSGAVYDPAASGPIVRITYSESSRYLNYSHGGGLALRQGGVVYYGLGFGIPNSWATTTQGTLLASNFDDLASGVRRPDFSAAGAPIEFGFYRNAQNNVNGAGYTASGGIDNWRVDLTVDDAVAAETTSWGGVKALFRAGAAAR